MKGKKIWLLFIVLLFVSSTVLALQYTYNQRIPISSGDEELGYVQPYQKNILGVDYAYLRWQRYGFPIGDSFPIALIKGTTTSLPFGIGGELLRVKIGEIKSSYVELTIDQSDIATELNNLDETLPENIEAITEDIETKTKPIIDGIALRINKTIQRNYHSSLHIIDVSNSKLKEVSNKIKDKEAELAEEIEDSVIITVTNYVAATLTAGVSLTIAKGVSITYSVVMDLIPDSFRHDITTFLYNIEYSADNIAESSLVDKGVATLYIGSPDSNKVSSQFNKELKNLGLPYFEGRRIIGKRNYSSNDIGIIVAIPEEKYWDENTLKNRWDKDKIRLYKTMIAGIGDNGLDAAASWYNSQLDLAKNSIAGTIRLIGGAADEAGVELGEIIAVIITNVKTNPKASIGFGTIAQGWILTGMSSFQEANFSRIDSLGYVVIVKKQGNSYRVLETHSLVGDKKNYFLEEYQEAVNEIADIAENTQEQIAENTNLNKITGKVIDDSLDSQEGDNKDAQKENPIVNFFKNIWRWIFG